MRADRGSDDGGDKAVPVGVKVYVTPSPTIDVGEVQGVDIAAGGLD